MRPALLLLILFAALASARLPETAEWQFRVLLDGKEIGYHDFEVRREGEKRTVQSKAKFDVKVLFVNAFRYRHENLEEWTHNCLTKIEAETDANGEAFVVRGVADTGEFRLRTADSATSLPSCVQTFAYWNPDFLNARQLLNSQTGEYVPVRVEALGADTVTVGNTSISAVKYRVQLKKGPITLWYSADHERWLALESVAAGGRVIRYEPVVIPASSQPALSRGQLARADSRN